MLGPEIEKNEQPQISDKKPTHLNHIEDMDFFDNAHPAIDGGDVIGGANKNIIIDDDLPQEFHEQLHKSLVRPTTETPTEQQPLLSREEKLSPFDQIQRPINLNKSSRP